MNDFAVKEKGPEKKTIELVENLIPNVAHATLFAFHLVVLL